MAVYTKITKSELENYLQNYNLGKLESFAEILSGIDNSNYKLATSSGEYILTLYEKRINEKDLPFFISLMAHLAGKNFNCPQVQKMNDGATQGTTLGRLAGRPCSIVSFLEGEVVEKPTPAQCFSGGKTLAKLHVAAADFAGNLQNALSIAGWQKLLAQTKQRADEVEAGLTALLETEFEILQKNWPKDLPAGIIHADFFKNNVFFKNNEISGVIDFYFACNDMLAYDIAIAINAWAFEAFEAFENSDEINFLPKHAKQFLCGYQSIRPLEKNEKQSFNILLRGAALRFLLTRVYDWLNVPSGALVVPHNPKDFIRQLEFFIKNSETDFFK